ncbi:MAG: hypothetical protein A3F40_00300 [Chlamydiae bacterium RIFCSPHIGHO2_12_FULL_27_8]|nr:MAG: hypothetical protein A3F40_00300 [Chlamydiae bacterium RIFCSPHIGHO2_12_FULL_27_8]
MKKVFIFILIFTNSIFSICFKDFIINTKKDDFIVYEFNKIYFLVKIFDIDDENVILEEVSIPKTDFNKNISFKNWFLEGAIGATSHLLFDINLKNSTIDETYSVTKNGWIEVFKESSIFVNLLDIKLDRIKDYERKKIGPESNEKDRRAVWNPFMFIESKKIPNPRFEVFKGKWPNDNSEFSLKNFEIYFDEKRFISLPYFIEINNGHAFINIKSVESGKNLKSNIQFFTRKPLKILKIEKYDNFLDVEINRSKDLKELKIYLIEYLDDKKIFHPVEFLKINPYKLRIELLKNSINKNSKYKLSITYFDYKNNYTEYQHYINFQ